MAEGGPSDRPLSRADSRRGSLSWTKINGGWKTVDPVMDQNQGQMAEGESSDRVDKDRKYRIVLVGKTGVGKSTAGNTILGRKVFRVGSCFNSVTTVCQSEDGKFGDRTIQVVDTPGLFDTEKTQDDIVREIWRCVELTAPGPDAIILVIEIDRFTKEEAQSVGYIKKIFGKNVIKFVILLFTGKHKLENSTLEKELKKAPEDLKNILQECNNRAIAFSTDNESEVSKLFDMIDQMLSVNGQSMYIIEYFKDAQEQLRQYEEKEKLKQDKNQARDDQQSTKTEMHKQLRMQGKKIKEIKEENELQMERSEKLEDKMLKIELEFSAKVEEMKIQLMRKELNKRVDDVEKKDKGKCSIL